MPTSPARHHVLRGAIPAFALLLLPTLAGCLTSTPDSASPDAAAAVVANECLGAARGHCAMTDGRLVVSGLELVPAAGGKDKNFPESTPEVGLLVDGLTVPLVIEVVDLRGFWIGIVLRDTCASCRVEIRESRIEAVNTAVQVGKAAPVRGGLSILRSTIVGEGEPPSERLTPGDLRGVGVDTYLIGIGTGELEGDLVLEDVAFEARGRALGPAVFHRMSDGAAFEARNVTVVGYEWGVNLQGEHARGVHVAGARFDCRGEAFHGTETYARALRVGLGIPVLLEDFDVRNCTWPEGCYPQCGTAMSIGLSGHGRANATGEAVLRNVTMVNNTPTNLDITKARVVLENLVVEDGLVGLEQVVAVELEMRNVTFRDLGWRAAFVDVLRLQVEGAVFEGNGLRGAQDGFPPVGGGLWVNGWEGPVEVHNSSFVGNEPLGLFAAGSLMNATDNWWGSPLGPSRRERLPGFGDVTDGLMLTFPHRMAPP